MSGIGSIGSQQSYGYAIGSNSNSNAMSSGKRINSAADDPSGLAIAEKLDNQATGMAVASNNAKDASNVLNLSDGAMSQIADWIGRIRELTLQSQNGIYSNEDRAIFQEEIDGALESINEIAKGTQFNGKTVLDGSFTAQNVAVGPNGESMELSIGSMLTDELGLTGFDVTSGTADIDVLDKALDKVLTERAKVGAYTNRLEHTVNNLDNAAYNTEVARSRIEDQDMAKAAIENEKNKTLEQVGISMQKMRMDGMGSYLQLLQ